MKQITGEGLLKQIYPNGILCRADTQKPKAVPNVPNRSSTALRKDVKDG